MSMEDVRRTYGVPARRGGRIRYSGGQYMGKAPPIDGRILSAGSGNRLRVMFDGGNAPDAGVCRW